MLTRIESIQFRKPVHQEVPHVPFQSLPELLFLALTSTCQHLHLYDSCRKLGPKAKFNKMNHRIMLSPERKFQTFIIISIYLTPIIT